MTNKERKEKIERINEKFRSLLEPYADQLRNTGLIVEWFPDDDCPDCSQFICCISKHDMDEDNNLICVSVDAPNLDFVHPELYDLDKDTPEIIFGLQPKIREIKETSITKTGIKIKTWYKFRGDKNTKKRILNLYLTGRNMLYRK